MEPCRRLAGGQDIPLPKGAETFVGRPWLPSEHSGRGAGADPAELSAVARYRHGELLDESPPPVDGLLARGLPGSPDEVEVLAGTCSSARCSWPPRLDRVPLGLTFPLGQG